MEKSEAKIQAEIFQWYWNNFCLPIHQHRQMIFHVPNERQLHLNGIGLYPGCADLVVIHNHVPLFVEVKIPNGKQSTNQYFFELHCKKAGLTYIIVNSLEEFKKIIEGKNS